MPKFSKSSRRRLNKACSDLQRLFNEVIKEMDCKVICSFRGEGAQNDAFKNGKSRVRFPYSKHNVKPSNAVDVVPYPLDWTDIESFIKLGEFVKAKAKELNINIEWGGDWVSLKDYVHYQSTL